MKQVTRKTLGVAVLGAAIAVSGSGVASAADTGEALEGAGVAASAVLNSLPVEKAASSLPAATSGTLESARQATGLLDQTHSGKELAKGKGKPKGKGKGDQLLGGLPLGGALGG